MKILLLSHKFYPDIGGIEVISELLADAFTAAGHQVRVVTWSEDTTHRAFRFLVVRKPGWRTLIREHAWADVVFENNPCFRLSWPKLIISTPNLVVLQTWLTRTDGRKALIDHMKTYLLRRSDYVVAISDAIRRSSWPSATVIANSYQSGNFRVQNQGDRAVPFAFLGRLVSDKGADLLLLALRQLLDEAKDLVPENQLLTIIGYGPELPALEAQTAELQLRGRVAFTGALSGEELVNCLNRHSFLVVPSRWEEPFGIVALEGMACGCVPLVSDGGGLPDAVGLAGLVFARGDVSALATAMRQLLENPSLAQSLRLAAPAHLSAHHPNVISARYLQMLERAARR